MTNLKSVLTGLSLVAAIAASSHSQSESPKWTKLDFPVGDHISGIHFIHSDTGFAVTSNGVLARTFDGGRTWQARNVAPGIPLDDLYFINSLTGFVCGRSGTLLRTIDGGYNWINESYADTAVWLLDIELIDSKIGLVLGATRVDSSKLGGLLLRTEDGGDTWKRQIVGGLGFSEIVNIPGGPVHFLGFGMLFTSVDSGKSWDSRPTLDGAPSRCFSIKGSTGIMGGPSGGCAYSRDGGRTWIMAPQPETEFYVACQMITDRVGYMGGFDGKLRRTDNGGSLWNEEALPVVFDIFDMQLVGTKLYIAGSNGTIIVGDMGPGK